MATDSEFDRNVKYQGTESGVTIRAKRNTFPWWIVLLLLPLLLLIKCNKTITVTCIDSEYDTPVPSQPVSLEYVSHFVYDNGKFFPDSLVQRSEVTNNEGTAVFDTLRCSVFSYIFYCFSDVKIEAGNDCFSGQTIRNFHFTRHVDLYLEPKLVDLHIKIIDAEKGYILPDAELKYSYVKNGETITETVKANAAGEVSIPGMRYCSKMQLLEASCYGYENCVENDVPCSSHTVADDNSAMRLKPVKKRVEFFVKDKDTKEPIATAMAHVTFTAPDGSKDERDVTTSIDGRGLAFCDDAFILSEIAIHAKKEGFGDGDLQGGPWRVDKFIEQDENTRTIWLERLPIATEYRNIDKINGKPIPGVTNKITVTAPDGTKSEYTETSNRNGVFVVRAKPGSKIEIVSERKPDYNTANTTIPDFQNKKEDIPMDPVMVELQFRTITATNGSLLPQCNLKVSGSISGSLAPNNSGNGIFTVKARLVENLSIVASKQFYKTNSTKIKNALVATLNNGPQNQRDIPLERIGYDYTGTDLTYNNCYDLFTAPATFSFKWSLCTGCTTITIKDDNGNVLYEVGYLITNNKQGSGTVSITSPTRKICVSVTNDNNHTCEYHIRP